MWTDTAGAFQITCDEKGIINGFSLTTHNPQGVAFCRSFLYTDAQVEVRSGVTVIAFRHPGYTSNDTADTALITEAGEVAFPITSNQVWVLKDLLASVGKYEKRRLIWTEVASVPGGFTLVSI